MPNYSVFDKTGKKVSDIALSDAIFAITPNASAMHSLPLHALKSEVAARSPGDRRVQAAQDRAQSEARSGPTAVSHSAPSPVSTARQSTRRSEDSL